MQCKEGSVNTREGKGREISFVFLVLFFKLSWVNINLVQCFCFISFQQFEKINLDTIHEFFIFIFCEKFTGVYKLLTTKNETFVTVVGIRVQNFVFPIMGPFPLESKLELSDKFHQKIVVTSCQRHRAENNRGKY